jgi:ribosomal protein S27AE
MKRGKCPRCHKFKFLTKHSKTGHHRPPFEYICRKCHDEIHGIKQHPKPSRKYQPGTPTWKRKS